MKKSLLFIVVMSLLLACGGTQKTTNYLQTGNYVEAFNNSADELRKDKTSKSAEKHIPLLKEAYDKAAAQDLAEIKSLEGQKSVDALKKIYGNYLNLDLRQDEVRVLQPLYSEGKEVAFDFKDYSSNIKKSKEAYASTLYTMAMQEMKQGKEGARRAHQLLGDLIFVDPTYKSNLTELSQKAKEQGSSFVLVTLKNNVRELPKDSLQGFSTINAGGFDNPWLIFHDTKDRKVAYDYQVDVTLDKLSFTPQETKQEQVQQQRQIQDGFKYQLDSRGNVMKDKEGNDIKVPNYKTVQAEIFLFQQNKASQLDGTVVIKKLQNNQVVSNTPMFGEAKFQNTYGKFRGDQRAIEQKYYEVLQAKEVPYPADYLFVNYAVMNFKQKVTQLLSQQKF